MFAYLRNPHNVHPTVWWMSGFALVMLVAVSGWNAYKQATAKPRAALFSVVQIG